MRLEPWRHLGTADAQKRQEQPRQSCAMVRSISRLFKIESEECCVVLHVVDQASLQSFDRLPELVLGLLDDIMESTFAVYGHAIYQIRIRQIVPHGLRGELVFRQPRGNLLHCLGLGALFVATTPTPRPGTSPPTAPCECFSSARCKEVCG